MKQDSSLRAPRPRTLMVHDQRPQRDYTNPEMSSSRPKRACQGRRGREGSSSQILVPRQNRNARNVEQGSGEKEGNAKRRSTRPTTHPNPEERSAKTRGGGRGKAYTSTHIYIFSAQTHTMPHAELLRNPSRTKSLRDSLHMSTSRITMFAQDTYCCKTSPR